MEDDEALSTLLAMGFPDLDEIKRALRMAKNDLNEAVAILTHEQPASSSSNPEVFGPLPAPQSHRADSGPGDVVMRDSAVGDQEEGFPLTHYYELESRVFQDNWSIPYKREESLGKCLVAATKLAEEGNAKQDGCHH